MNWAPLIVGIILLIGIALLASCDWEETQPGDGKFEQGIAVAINGARNEVGLPSLPINHELSKHARVHCAMMWLAGRIYHSDSITGGAPDGWTLIGEIVGRGPTEEAIMEAWDDSMTHASVIYEPDWDSLGIGAFRDGEGTVWVAVRFFRGPR